MAGQADPVVVVLAAGAGSRFRAAAGAPGHKLAQPFGSSTVLGSTLARVFESGLPCVVVTTGSLAPLALAVVGPDDLLVLPAADDADTPFGMGHSIAAGVAARPNAAGWLLLPGDMPMVQAASLRAVAAALGAHALAHAEHRGRRGHPVGFRAELRGELLGLGGDEGARGVLARHAARPVPVDDAGVLLDIDTEADLAHLRALHAGGG